MDTPITGRFLLMRRLLPLTWNSCERCGTPFTEVHGDGDVAPQTSLSFESGSGRRIELEASPFWVALALRSRGRAQHQHMIAT
jgi:hypothetical protein